MMNDRTLRHLGLRSILGCLLVGWMISGLLSGCSAPVQKPEGRLSFDRNIVADRLGDRNGVATENEIQKMNAYFTQNSEGWCLGGFPAGYETAQEIPITVLQNSLKDVQLEGPYKSEAELRQALKGLSFRTPFLGIYHLRQENQTIAIVQYFRAPGPDMAASSWTQIKMIE